MSPIRRWRTVLPIGMGLSALAAAACDHTEPFDQRGPAPLGPPSTTIPRQLTFNPGDDRSPAVAGYSIVYSRYDPGRGTRAQCVAILPVEGGTLRATYCPPAPTAADSMIGTWLEPALSPSRARIAFVWERGDPLSALGAWSHHLTVAPADSAIQGRETLIAGWASGDRFYNTAVEPNWSGEDTVRFLAAYQQVFKVKGGGADRFTDTLLVPRALMALRLSDGTVGPVPGGDSVIAYAPAADGGTWIVKESNPGTLLHLDPAGALTPAGAFPGVASDLAEVDARVVAAIGGTVLPWIDPATGATGSVAAPGPVHRIAPVQGRRLIAEVELDGRDFGAPAHLWLLELPPRAAR
jgi:hypothetical protein